MIIPKVGDKVTYVSRGSMDGVYKPEMRSAEITAVGAWVDLNHTVPYDSPAAAGAQRTVVQEWHPYACGLKVTNDSGLQFVRQVEYHAGDVGTVSGGVPVAARSYPGGTWHWPDDAATTVTYP